jgi:hypothetical protein
MADDPGSPLPGLRPYGLRPPARILVPAYAPFRGGEPEPLYDDTCASLGDGARLRRRSWRAAGHQPQFMLEVACDALPHCMACECGSQHEIWLDDTAVRALKSLLPG